MAGRGQAIAAHTAVIFFLVGSLSVACQTDNHVSGLNIGVIDNVRTFHAAGHRTVNNHRTRQIADIGCLSTGAIHTDSHVAKFCHQFIVAIDDGRNDFTRNQHLIATDGARNENIVNSTHTDQVIDIHDERILCDTFPDGEVAGFFPIHVGKAGLGASTIGVHDVAILWITA